MQFCPLQDFIERFVFRKKKFIKKNCLLFLHVTENSSLILVHNVRLFSGKVLAESEALDHFLLRGDLLGDGHLGVVAQFLKRNSKT